MDITTDAEPPMPNASTIETISCPRLVTVTDRPICRFVFNRIEKVVVVCCCTSGSVRFVLNRMIDLYSIGSINIMIVVLV